MEQSTNTVLLFSLDAFLNREDMLECIISDEEINFLILSMVEFTCTFYQKKAFLYETRSTRMRTHSVSVVSHRHNVKN